jgi:hypothetical protein
LPGEVVIEIDVVKRLKHPDTVDALGNRVEGRFFTRGNGDVLFFPAQAMVLRSRFLCHRVGLSGSNHSVWALDSEGGIPGMRVHLNRRERYGRISDALGDEANKGLLRRLREIGQRNEPPFDPGTPNEDKMFDTLTDSDMDTWEYWMVRLLTEVEGSVFAREVQDCSQLRSREVLERLGTVKLAKLHPAGAIVCQQQFYDGNPVVDGILSESELKAVERVFSSDPVPRHPAENRALPR